MLHKTPSLVLAVIIIAALSVSSALAASNIKGNVEEQPWTQAFEAQKDAKFAEAFAEDVVLDASAMMHSAKGRDRVKAIMGTVSKYYDSCIFTNQVEKDSKTYLEWDVLTSTGLKMSGVTILTKNSEGQLQHIAIHHRPMKEMMIFSKELGDLLIGTVVERDTFYEGK